LSLGTLEAQPAFSQQALYEMIPCTAVMQQTETLPVFPVKIENHHYYQGRCACRNDEELIGAIAVNLSQKIEKQEIQRILIAVLAVAMIALGVSFGVSLLLSRQPINSIKNVMEVIGAIAEGDLRSTARAMTQDQFGILAMRVNRMLSRLRAIVDRVQEAGVQVSASSAELSATTKQQDTIMGHQLESINRVVQSVQDISEVTRNLVETMQRVAVMSQEAAGFASSGQSDLFRMEEAMRRMEDASTGISDKLETINEKADNITVMVTTINKVSEQTNLLSLNASIEAEKAGEYGRGFSVVAREIRRLADQTAVATLDIDRMMQEMQSAVSAGIMEMDKFISEVQRSADDVAKISMQLTLIIDQVQALSPNFDEVKTAMSNQSENAQQINLAIVQVSEEMQQIKTSLHETYTSIAQLNEAAQGLHDEVSRFQVK
jgi:methyl-accepting chemotaxis protein WspA